MTSVEKRRSGRKSGGHRKHSDGGYSDTSSCGSFLDETDREVSNLTDRAFRSLCIGDEAVYNDSDLCSSSPCVQRDRQLAFSHSGQDRDKKDRERGDLKRAAHESFSLRMQQYGQDWFHGGMYGAEIQRDPQWEGYGERTQGRVSATFQHSFVETSQQGEPLGEAEMSLLSNGATELSSQQRRSRSRVSSLIRAFNSEGQRDGAGMNDILRERTDETSWDKSALMSIQRELSEFSTSYQQNVNSGHFPSAGSFSCQDTDFYSSEVAAVAHMNSASSFVRASHSKHNMSTQVNCNSNFFIHSEFSPFKVWRDHNRFPFQQGEVSGYMHCSEFPKWYETPMYRELSLETQPQGPYRFEERGVRYPRNNLAPMVPPTYPRSTSTSTMLQKASALEKRCESELTGHYPHRKRTQSLGANRLPSQRPLTASPTSEMSRRVQDTISSVKALQQKIKMMTEQTGMTTNQQGVLYGNDNFIPFSNDAKTVAPNVVSCNTSTTPFNMSQLLTPSVHAPQEAETPEVRQYAVSPQPVEHPPVRAESRGATPDIRMSTYKSRATSLLFNLKDNRKRVKSTYSPAKFKGLEMEKNKEASIQEPKDIVIDIPEFSDPDFNFLQVEDSSRTNAASHQYVNQYPSPGLLLTTNTQPAHAGQYSEYTDYQTALMQSEMVHHPGFTGFTPGNFASNQPTNGQNLYEDSSSLTLYQQGMMHNVDTQGGDLYRLKPSYTATETQRQNADKNHREYLISKANAEQHFNETVGWEFTKVDKYQQLKDNKHDYSNVSSQDRWRKTDSKDADNLSVKAVSPWKQEMTALLEKDQHAEAYQRAELNSQRDKYKVENISKELPQNAPFSNDPSYFGQEQSGAFNSTHAYQNSYAHTKDNEMKHNYLTENYNSYADQEHRNQHTMYHNTDKSMLMQETGQKKQHTPIPKVYEMLSPQPTEAKPQFEHNMHKNALSNPYNVSALTMANQVEDRQFVEVKAEQVMADQINAQHTQAELAKSQHWAQVEQPRPESARLILARQTGSEKVKAEGDLTDENRLNQNKTEHIKEERKQEEQSREKQTEDSREEWINSEQTRIKRATEEPRHIKEEAKAEHLRQEQGEQGEQVEAKQAEPERLKEELVNTEPAKTEQARLEQAKSEQVRRETVKAEQTEEEQIKAKQDEREWMEAEQIRTEQIKTEKADAEHRKAEEAKLEQIQAEQAKTRIAEAGKVKAHQMQVEDVKKGKPEEDSGQAGQVNVEQPTTQVRKAEERQREQAKLEQTKVDLAKAELTQTEQMQEKSAKPAAKLTVTQQVKSEPDKVLQVKTELAKAKAELAKIKEKMREEQKEKDRNTVPTKEDGIKTDAEHKDQDHAAQMSQQREDSVGRQYKDQANITLRATDEYERLREKYGFTDTNPPNRNYVSAAGKDSSNEAKETLVSLDKVETKNDEKSKAKLSPTSQVVTANTENMEDVSNFKRSGLTESQYVYSESSKEFKLSGNYFHNNVDKRTNSDTVADRGTDDSVDKLEKRTDISQQKDLDMAKSLPLEKKPKSTEHSKGPGKDQHICPPRALSHKERAQTKQEILTSKIKAHAEKEISAIKEKGFAVRDGIISKNSTKQLSGSQSNNIRQRPPSQDATKKHDSTISSNITPKHQMEPSGIQKVPKEPMKSNDNEPKPHREAKHTDERWEDKKKEKQSEIRSPIQSNEQKRQEKQGAHQGENLGKQKEGLKDNPAITTAHFNKKTEDPSQGTDLVQAENSKPMTTDKTESKHEVVHEDSAPSLSLVFGQKADDSLQIRGIMVTVREKKPSVDSDQRNDNGQMNVKEKECSTSEIEQCHSSSGLATSKGNALSKEVSTVKPNDGGVQTTVKDDQTKVGNNHPKNAQENSTLETKENIVSQTVSVRRTNSQQESSSIETRPQRVTQALEPLTEKGVPSTVTVPAKNKVLAETQPPLYKQDIIAIERKDSTNETAKDNSSKSIRKDGVKSTEENCLQKRQTAQSNENFTAEVVNTKIRCTNDSNRADAESRINQPSAKEDMATGINASKSKNIDGKSAPLVEEKRRDSTPPEPFNNTSASNHLIENESTHVYPTLQYQEAHPGENKEVDDNVHIGSIAIRVVPSVSKRDNLKMAETYQVTAALSDVANEQKQVTALSVEESKTLNNQDRTKDHSPTSSEKQVKDSLAEESTLVSVRKLSNSPKIDNQQNSINTTSDTQDKNEKPEKVNKSGKSVDELIRPMVEDYFQVQGMVETNNVLHKCTNVGHMSDAVLKGREFPRSPPNEAAISNKSCHERKHEAFVLDQSKRKTVESSSVRVQDEDMKRKIRETKESLVSKQNDGPTERWSNKNEKTEVGQAVRKHHTENPSVLSARERQSSRNSHPTKENMGKEKAEAKSKPKERVTTIPEISAIADYARLKVIVSEDEANTSQEFPPNKKEGFFPLIQTRHSRRPVFTADPQDFSVKEKPLPNNTEVFSKVNKESKPLVFPITEKEHQRTGMFKLGDKERQEKMLLGAKANENVLDTGVKHVQHLKEQIKLPTSHLKNQGSQQVSATQNVRQEEQSIHHPNNSLFQATTSSSAVHRPKSNSASQHQKLLENPHEKPVVQVNNIEESTANALARTGEERTEKMRVERQEDAGAQQQSRAKPSEEKQASRIEEERRAEERVKHMIEETRASLAEEERRAAQREEERRAREREAIAIKIKERREKQRRAERRAEEERAAQKEEERRAKQREDDRTKKETEEKRTMKITKEEHRAQEEQQRRAAQEQQRRRVAQKELQRRAALEEQQRGVAQEEQRRAAQEEQQKKAAQEEQQRRAAQEQQTRVAQEEQRRAAQEEQQRRAAQEEQQRRAAQEEQQRKAAQEEQQRRAAQEEQRRAAQEEQQRRAAQEEQRRAAQEEQQRRAAQEEQQRRAAQEEQRRAAQEEQQRRAAQEEQRRDAQEEQQKKAAQEEQQRRAAQEEQRKAVQEEQLRRAAQEEQQRRAAQEEQRRAAQEEQLRRAAQEEQQRKAVREEQQRRAAREEQQRKAAQEEQQRRAAQEEQRRAAQEEQQRRAAQEEQQRRAAQEEQRRAAQEEQQRKAVQEEQQRRAAQEEQQRRAVQEEQQRRAAQEEQRRAAQEEQQRKAVQEEQQRRAAQEEQQRRAVLNEEKKRRAVLNEEKRQAMHKEEKIFADIEEERIKKQRRAAQEQMLAQTEEVIRAKQREEEDEKLAAHREKEINSQTEEQKRTTQRMDALQYYAITSTESAQETRERQLCSPLPSQQRQDPSGLEEFGSHRPHRPQLPASPAPSLSRSNTSSPALGVKPSMFRVKDNTFRGSSFTKSVKPRFHKTFGEDLRVGSPMERGSERGEEDQEITRRSAGTPVYPDTGSNRLAAIKESSTFRPGYSSQDYSASLPQHRPYSRRSVALDEDDSRSIVSNMSEDVQSFATSVADLADIRGLYDYERPESACSFSSDVSRTLGKPPTVPPKSEKALRRAQRLTTRRIKKELSKLGTDSSGVEKSLQEVSNAPSSSSTEVRSSSRQAVASPHFSPPVSLAHAPTLGSSLPSSHPEPSHSSFYASPHATGPISLPVASPHATAPISLPVASLNVTGSASHTVAPKTVAHVPSSPTLHHATPPVPVTQYHVESSYPHSYPLTQRKVLQDLGSGQYFVVDVPVQVKTKTFFDPETGKYVQLNVRESGQGTSRLQPQQTYPQSQLQPQVQPQPTPANKTFALYQGNHGYPQDYQPQTINSVPCHRSAAPSTLHQDQQPARESHSYGHPAPETGQNSEVHRYSPEKTPYMDTFNDKDKSYNTVYNTHGPYESLLECDTNSQLAKGPVCENENSAHSQCQPRDIITMSELEDFMEVSDW